MISELIDSRRWKRHAREVQSKLELDDAARFVLEKFKKRGGAALDQIAAWLQAQQRLDELNSHLGAFASEQERERFVREISPRPFLVANRLRRALMVEEWDSPVRRAKLAAALNEVGKQLDHALTPSPDELWAEHAFRERYAGAEGGSDGR